MPAPKTAGPNATPLANWHATPIMGSCIGEVSLAGRVTFSSAGAVSLVSGVGFSVVATGASGVYRVYVPACTDLCAAVTYGTTATFANKVALSGVAQPKSGYFDITVHSAAGVSLPASGDYCTFIVSARTRKPQV